MSKDQVKHEFPVFEKLEIVPDNHDDYSLTGEHIFSHHYSEYFDSGERIVSIVQKNKYLAIQIFTTKQVNLFFDIFSSRNIDFIEINASKSPICVDGVFYANRAIKIKAESLAIYRDMQSENAIELDVAGTISFEKLLKTNFLSVSADQFENLGLLQIGKLANFAVKNYIQTSEAKSEAEGAWCFSGDCCQLAGQFAVQEKFYIKTHKLVLGGERFQSSIIAKGNIYLSTDNIETYGNTVCEMKQNVSTDYVNITVNSRFSLNKESKFNIFNAKISLDNLDNIGSFQADNCEIGIRKCYQKNKLNFKNSITIFEDFFQKDNALTQISEGKDSKKLIVKYMDVDAGQVILKKVNSFGAQWNIRQGAMVIEDSDVGIEQNLYLYDPAKTQLSQSNIQVNQVLMLNGVITFNGCNIRCQSIDAQGSVQKSLIHDSQIYAEREIIFWKNLQIYRTKISSYQFSIKGDLQIERVELNIIADVTWKMNTKSTAKKIQLFANQINFYSPEVNWGEPGCFSESIFKAKVVNHKGVTQFLDSEIYGSGEGRISHSIQGDMRLKNSKFYTDSQTFHYEKSKIKLEEKSHFQSGIIANNGKIDTTKSTITSKILLQDKAGLKSKGSLIKIEDTIYNRNSKMSISDKSEVIAGNIIGSSSHIDLIESTLSSQKSIIFDRDSKMVSSKSFIAGSSISFAGSVQLSKTKLKGQDLVVFNQFSVTDGSLIEIEKTMQVAWESIFTLERSTLLSSKLVLSGNSTVDDSQVKAKQIETQLLSKTTLAGNTIIEAKDIIMRDHLETQSKEVKVKNNNKEESKRLIPQVVAEDQLKIEQFAHVIGDSLITESQQMEVKGEIKLSENLISKGGSFINDGRIEAKNRVFLGFDDYAINYGYISADDVIIHSNLLNIFGRIRARENFTNSGFFSLNLGIYQAPTTVVNSLFSLNAGLILPDFSKGFSSLFNPRNLSTAGRIALSSAFPGYANLINFGFMIPNLLGMGRDLYGVYQKCKDGELTWQSMSKLRRHELMPKICQIKSSTMFLYNACKSRNTVADFNWVDTGKQIISSLGGSYIDESILHLNMGLSATHNVMKTNFMHFNTGAELALQSHLINTHYLFNSGLTHGDQSVLLGDQIFNSGSMGGLSQFSITADTLVNRGSLDGNNNNFNINAFYQEGIVNFKGGLLKIGIWHDNQNSSSQLNNLKVQGDSLTTSGNLNAEGVHFDLVNNVVSESSAALEFKDVTVKTSHLDHAGKMDYQGQLKVETECFQSKSGSEIRGQISDQSEGVSQRKENDVSAAPNHRFTLESKETVLGGVIFGGDSTQINTNKLKIDQMADVNIPHGLIKSSRTEVEGNLGLTASRLESEKTLIKKEGELSLNRSVMQGETLDVLGELNADKAYLDVSKSVVSGKSATLGLKDIEVKTSEFDHAGKMNYQGQCVVESEIFKTQKGSEIQGEISHFSEIIVQRKENDIAQQSPKHQLALQSEQTILGGNLSGGDTTQIVTDRLKVDQGGDVNIPHGSIKSGETEIDGSLALTSYSLLDSSRTQVDEGGRLSLDHSGMIGKDFVSRGETVYEQALVEEENIRFLPTATEYVKDSNFQAKNFDDSSHLGYQGNCFINTEKYSHGGDIHIHNDDLNALEEDVFYIKSDTADLSGSAQITHGIIDVEKFDQVSQLTAGSGQYSDYNFSKSLDVSTQASVNLNDKIQRDCDVIVTGKSVNLNTAYDAKHTLGLCSTQGDVNISSTVNGRSLLVDSAADIRTNQSIQTERLINFQAKGGFYNERGKLNSEKVFIKTGGNIENKSGEICARDYAQLVSDGDILNVCDKRSYNGKHDTIVEYDPALIEGGSGKSREGLGLFVQARDKVKCEASHFQSQGDIYIEGAQGVQMEARYDTHVSKDKTHKKWYGKKTHKVKTHTDVYPSVVHSDGGRSTIRSGSDGVSSIATEFSSDGGTDVYSQGTVNLQSLRTQDKNYKSKKQLWGLTKSSHKETIQSATPTLFVDNGTTRIHSESGDVDARDALFIGDGDLEIKAEKSILFGREVLNHKTTDKSQSVSVSIFGIDPVEALKSKQAAREALSIIDPTLSKVNQLAESETALEAGVNASNLGLNVYNTTRNVMNGVANENLSDELLSRNGLGGPEGFNPTISLNFKQSKATHQFQTLGSGGVNRNNVTLEAGEGIQLENGVQVHANKDMQIKSPEIMATAAELRSKYRQENRGAKVGVTITGQVTDVGVNYSKQKQEIRSHVNSGISAGGHLDLGEVERVALKGASIEAGSISGHIKKLEVETLQDVTRSSTKQVSASTSGQGSIYVGSESSRIVNQVSGIHVKDGINHDEKNTFTVDHYHSKGGVITSDGQNNFKAQEVISKSIHDRHKKSGIGFSGNLRDLEGTVNSKASGTLSENSNQRSIPVSTISVDHKNFKATQQSVIHGKRGTQIEIGSIKGRICTDEASGYRIKKDVSTHFNVDVPLPQADHKEVKSIIVAEPEKSPQIPLEDQSQAVEVEIPLSDLHFDSVEQEQAFNHVIEKAVDEFTTTQKFSPETQKELSSTLSTALKSVKIGGECGFDKLSSVFKNEHRGVKCYIGAKGLMFSFAMNTVLSSSDSTSTKGLLTEAVAETVSERIVGSALSRVGAGPVGWVMTGVDLLDGLVYDEKVTGHLKDKAKSHIEEAFNTQDFQLQQVYLEMADNQLETVGTMEALHKTNQILNIPGDIIKEGIKKIVTFDEAPVSSSGLPKQSQNRFHLFNSSKKGGIQSLPNFQPTP